MYQLKAEFKNYYTEHEAEIKEVEAIFYSEDDKYLHTHQLPKKWKSIIDNLWYHSPLSKIQDGFYSQALLDYERADLKQDGICKHNINKDYWIKAYMLGWIEGMPDIADDKFLMSCIGRRPAYTCLIKNAYEVKQANS